jgi:hypothetical protein
MSQLLSSTFEKLGIQFAPFVRILWIPSSQLTETRWQPWLVNSGFSLLRRLFRVVVTPRFFLLMAIYLVIVFSGFGLRCELAGVVPCGLQSKAFIVSAGQTSTHRITQER